MNKNVKKNNLGKWALIDLETTGADGLYDSIIDVGYLQFEDNTLIRRYESLIRPPMDSTRNPELSHFIQKLTGITSAMLSRAPRWEKVAPELGDLAEHQLIAHNSSFEQSFLDSLWSDILPHTQPEVAYQDSMLYLALLHPGRSSLNLEGFIIDYKLAEKEEHRGLQDSIDLLKVLLIATFRLRQDKKRFESLRVLIERHHLQEWWWFNFMQLDFTELEELASSIDFDLRSAYLIWQKSQAPAESINVMPSTKHQFDSETVRTILEDEKLLRQVLPHYRHRPAQVEMALKTGQSFKNGVHSMIQAPTGTGKTLGYLLPAALFSIQEKKPVLVATGTKALQEQAVKKDIPQLRAILGENAPRVERLVGSGNHWCELLFREGENDAGLLTHAQTFEEKFSRIYLDQTFFENAQRDAKDSILRDQLPYVLKRTHTTLEKLDREVAVDFRACTGSKCPLKNDCSYIKGLRAAKEADIILGNHALMFTWPKGIPKPDYIIVDEAHKIEHEATNAYSFQVSERSMQEMIKNLTALQGIGPLFYLLSKSEAQSGESTPIISQLRQKAIETATMANDHVDQLPLKIELYFKKRPRYSELYWNEAPMPKQMEGADMQITRIMHHLESLQFIFSHLYEALLPYLSRWEVASLDDDTMIIALTRFESFMALLQDIVLGLKKGMEKPDSDPSLLLWSRSLRYHAHEGFTVSTLPIDVGQLLHDQLLLSATSVVFTSATLGNTESQGHASKSVEWATGHLYLEPTRRFKAPFFLPAAFDYAKNTIVRLCDDVPELYQQQFVPFIIEKISPLIEKLQGRSLLLFSAKTRFEEARELLLARFEGNLPLFIQGMGASVVEDFKKSGRGILLGMESFGEGIDVPGEDLQFILIDKVPDLRMDLVIQDRREFFERTFSNEFSDYYLSGRVRSLQQKLGRLLRTENDIGAAIVVDARLRKWHGKTMSTVNRLLRPYEPKRTSLEQAIQDTLEFLRPVSVLEKDFGKQGLESVDGV